MFVRVEEKLAEACFRDELLRWLGLCLALSKQNQLMSFGRFQGLLMSIQFSMLSG